MSQKLRKAVDTLLKETSTKRSLKKASAPAPPPDPSLNPTSSKITKKKPAPPKKTSTTAHALNFRKSERQAKSARAALKANAALVERMRVAGVKNTLRKMEAAEGGIGTEERRERNMKWFGRRVGAGQREVLEKLKNR